MSPSLFVCTVIRSGTAKFNDRSFNVRYFSTEFASLHFYQYTGGLRIGDKTFTVQPGDVSFTPFSTPSWYNLSNVGTHHYIHLGLSHDDDWSVLRHPMLFRSGVNQRQMKDRFEMVHRYMTLRQNSLASEAAGLVASEILSRLILDKEQAFPLQPDPVSKAAIYLEENLESDISIPGVADEVGMSPNYLAVRFREEYGMTMKRFLLQKRIETSKFLLASTELTVVAIGKRVGIPDPQYFNKLFRKEVGFSPSRFRKRS